MLLAIAFLMFAALLASWLIVPDGEGEVSTVRTETVSPEAVSAPSHA